MIDLIQPELIPTSKLLLNSGQLEGVPKNPRFIKDERYTKLIRSIQDDPEMLGARELLVYAYEGKYIVLGGNMRLRACKELGIKEVPCKVLPELSPDKLRSIVIKDNVAFGSDDFDMLANDWDIVELVEWGVEIPSLNVEADGEGYDGEGDFDDEGSNYKSQYGVIVMCESEGTQESVFNDLTKLGFKCKIVVT